MSGPNHGDESRNGRFTSNCALLASIVASSNDAILSEDLEGVIRSWNSGAERLFRYTADEAIGRPIDMLSPGDSRDEELAVLERIRRDEPIDDREIVRRRKDGSPVVIAVTESPIRDADGRIVGVSQIARDVTGRRKAEEQNSLLLREMSHRVKNLFAIASALVTLSARSSNSVSELAFSLRQRFAALAQVHELTQRGVTGTIDGKDGTTTLHGVVRAIFAPFSPGDSPERNCLVLTGCDCPIGRASTISAALVFQELVNNAVKYGAIKFGGAVHIESGLSADRVSLTWKEHGGPSVQGKPDHRGFGTEFMSRIVKNMHGDMTHEWQPDGLVIRLAVPLRVLRR